MLGPGTNFTGQNKCYITSVCSIYYVAIKPHISMLITHCFGKSFSSSLNICTSANFQTVQLSADINSCHQMSVSYHFTKSKQPDYL